METVPGFPTVTPHDLRHTAASLAISAGANPKAVQTMLGHASAVLTLDTYADLFPDDLEIGVMRYCPNEAGVPVRFSCGGQIKETMCCMMRKCFSQHKSRGPA